MDAISPGPYQITLINAFENYSNPNLPRITNQHKLIYDEICDGTHTVASGTTISFDNRWYSFRSEYPYNLIHRVFPETDFFYTFSRWDGFTQEFLFKKEQIISVSGSIQSYLDLTYDASLHTNFIDNLFDSGTLFFKDPWDI